MWSTHESLPALGSPPSLDAQDLAAVRWDIERALFPARQRPVPLGRYTLERFVAAGGCGQVFEGFDPELDRKVAIKLVKLGAGSPRRHGDAIDGLRREAQAMARVSDPHVVPIYDVGSYALDDADCPAGVPSQGAFVVMALVEGESLAAVSLRPAAWSHTVRLMAGAARGLAAAHRHGLVHRDFKPSNVLVDRSGRARVLDFGLAAWRADTGATPEPWHIDTRREATLRGAVVGTPAYMAPEQHLDAGVDARADQYAFCVTLFELLHGRRPFAAIDLDALARAKASPLGPAAFGRSVPRQIRALIVRGLQPRPEDRWPTMTDVALELERALADRRRPMLVAGGLGLAVVAAAAMPRAERACPAPARDMTEVWSPGRSAALTAALRSSSAPYAEVTAQRVERRLSAYAQQWRSTWASTCPTTDAEASPAADCLRQRLLEFEAAVQLLSQRPEATVEHALASVRGLLPPAQCQGPHRGVSTDAATRWTLGSRVARVGALVDAGLWDEAIALARETIAAAERSGSAALGIEARIGVADALVAAGEPGAAEPELQRAYFDAAAADVDELAGAAALRLAGVVGLEQGRPEQGLAWLEHAGPWLDRANDPRLLAQQRRVRGRLASARGDEREAARELGAAVTELEVLLGPDHPELAQVLGELGDPLHELGDDAQARAVLERAHAIVLAEFGPDHPRVARAEFELGAALMRSTPAQARGHLDAALRVWERAHGPSHPDVANALLDLGIVHASAGEFDVGIALTRRARAIFERSHGRDSRNVARAASNLGRMLDEAGFDDEALEHLQHALATWERIYGTEHPRVGTALFNLGRLRSTQGHHAQGVADLRRALAIWRRSYGDDHPRVGAVGEALAEAEHRAAAAP